MIRLFVLFTALLFVSAPTWADFKVIEKTQYHTITEKDPYKVLDAAARSIGRECSGGHAVGCAASSYSYQYQVKQVSEKRCRVSKFTMKQGITYHIPKWAHARKSDYRSQWKSIEAEILKHEKNHGSIYKKTLREAYNSLRSFTTNCSDIKSTINNRLERAKEKADKKHATFHKRKGESLSRPFPYK